MHKSCICASYARYTGIHVHVQGTSTLYSKINNVYTSYTCVASSQRVFRKREQLMSRANSLKKAIRQIIEHTEKAVDDQNGLTEQIERENSERYGIQPSSSQPSSSQPPPPGVLVSEPVDDGDDDDVVATGASSSRNLSDNRETTTSDNRESREQTAADTHNVQVHYSLEGSTVKVQAKKLERQLSETFGVDELDAALVPPSECVVHQQADDSPPVLRINIPQRSHDMAQASSAEHDTSTATTATQASVTSQMSPPVSVSTVEMDSLRVPPPRFPSLRERRPVDQSLTISTTDAHLEKFESEQSEKLPLSPIPGSPSLLTPFQVRFKSCPPHELRVVATASSHAHSVSLRRQACITFFWLFSIIMHELYYIL